jgi:hypothetical protein
MERSKCQNVVDKVLYHGTGHEAIAEILTKFYIQGKCNQHGKGIYFTEDLDSTWIYGGEIDEKLKIYNKDHNRNIIVPPPGSFMTFLACAIYYDKNGLKRVYDHKRNPQKNEINFALSHTDDLSTVKTEQPDKRRFYGTEYVVGPYEEQICPFLSIKLKREEYCIIWKDESFSSEDIYKNQFDPLFKDYLKQIMDFINKFAQFNLYPCNSSNSALELIKRKKYNKIILISNCGQYKEGKSFVENARKIIGNDTITLFSAYNEGHLKWIREMKNALFANQAYFIEKFIECFSGSKVEERLKLLVEEMEGYYNVKFNFDQRYLLYPWFDQIFKENSDKSFSPKTTFGNLTF